MARTDCMHPADPLFCSAGGRFWPIPVAMADGPNDRFRVWTCRRRPRRPGAVRDPQRASAGTSSCKRVALLDDLISAKEQTVGNFLSERLRGF
jgi:hypothetical protein